MIKLVVQDYCQECRDFRADVQTPMRGFVGEHEIVQSDTIIRCDNASRCANIVRYLQRQGTEVKDGD